MDKMGLALVKMILYNSPDVKRINHALKVYGYAKAIGAGEGLSDGDLAVLEGAAIFHDIGIHEAERKYQSAAGPYQEELGPSIAAPMLLESGFTQVETEEIKYLIGHHHTYNIKGNILLQLLIEADFIVNIEEDKVNQAGIKNAKEKIFQSATGQLLLDRVLPA